MNIVLVGGIAALGRELIASQVEGDFRLDVISDPAEVPAKADLLERADVVVGWPLSPGIVAAARNVKLIHVAGAGVDGVPFDFLPDGVTVCNTFHHETSIAEHVLMTMLVLTRQPASYDRRLREGNWWDSCIWGGAPHLRVLEGTTALVYGLGHIAREIARRARPFGVRCIAVSRDPKPSPEVDLVVGHGTRLENLAEADFVIPTCPLTPETEGLIGPNEFARMKRSAFLINIARGKVVDEDALYEALRDRRIAGAAIDVWYQYPKDPAEHCAPSKHPFHELDNVLMTPHVSAWTWRTVEGRMRDIAANINHLAAGRPLTNVVHPSR